LQGLPVRRDGHLFGVPKYDFTLISGCSVFPFLVAQRTGSKSAMIGLILAKDFDAGKLNADFAKRISA
jgi:hypothetical protein